VTTDDLMEAAMIGTLLVCLAALVIAVLGCAWVAPNEIRQADELNRRRRT
jgi:hypothetical protein